MKKQIFKIVLIFFIVVFIAVIWRATKLYFDQGKDLNRTAWEASYTERNMEVPKSGPRDGYWGSRRGNAVEDQVTVWRDAAVQVPDLLDVDSSGYQYYRSKLPAQYRIVIVGASVASGAYASSIDKTYFNVIGRELQRHGTLLDITIIASGAWKSTQEIAALGRHLKVEKPDLVVFLNGLNDLTCGASARHLYGEPFQTQKGEIADPLYHSHDYLQRVSYYLDNLAAAQEMIAACGARMLVVLQPSLNERSKRTPVEEKVLKASLLPHLSSAVLTESYESIRVDLLRREKTGSLFFLDASRIFDQEKETIFSDLWHFSDVGHRVLGSAMADRIFELIKSRK